MGEFLMPSLGADMEVGTIVEWRVKPGDAVHRGDIIAVVDTEKSTIEVEVFEDGVVEKILVEPEIEVPVGTPLAVIGAGAEVVERELVTVGTASDRVRSSPYARRLAAAGGVELKVIEGTGPAGAVVAADVASHGVPVTTTPTAPPPPPPAVAEPAADSPGKLDKQAAMRHAIAAAMTRSKREIPHYYLATTVDMTRPLTWLTTANAERSVSDRLLPAVLLLKATALAAREVPAMNGFWDDGPKPSDAVHLGVAIALRGGGLIAPAIHDADALSLDALMASLKDLVARTRAGSLRSSEMSDPTLTVTNLGDLGVEEVYGVIYPPQVAIVGFGRIVERPWAVEGLLGVRPLVRVTVSGDHRASDGHDGARFLAAIDRLLQTPEAL